MTLLIEFPATGEAALDLRCLLYRGGAAAHADTVASQIEAGKFGSPIKTRIPLVKAFHREMQAQRIEGIAVITIKARSRNLRKFVAFIDAENGVLDKGSVTANFRAWIGHMNRRERAGEIAKKTVYSHATRVAALLATALGVPLSEVTYAARMKKPKGSKVARRWQKQNLGEVREFVRDLLDIIQSLNLDALKKRLPLEIALTSTGLNYPHWSRMWPDDLVKAMTNPESLKVSSVHRTVAAREAKAKDQSLAIRYPLLNLRTSAEFMLFIANTGMNREQATKLTLGDFRFQSFENHTLVKAYKGRLGGEVEFPINAGYRPYFEQYLAFRRQAYPEGFSDRMFVNISATVEANNRMVNTQNLANFLQQAGRPWIAAQILRSTKGNVLARLAGISEAARSLQNSKVVFNRHYAEPPSHQLAATELTAFWKTVSEAAADAVGPGACEATNGPVSLNRESSAHPDPDCINPAGCLFCAFNRGIESLDYVWNLLSYRALKSIELSRYKRPLFGGGNNPARATLERINQLVVEVRGKGAKQSTWVDDVEGRMASGNFHPRWEKWIAMTGIC